MAKKKQPKAAIVDAEPINEDEFDASYVKNTNAQEDHGEDDDDDDEEEDEMELLQVDLGDMVKLKQVLDEAVASVLLEKVAEDYRWDNVKLIIMTLACGFAMLAQFAPMPFPDSRPLLGVCGTLYFVLSGVLQLVATFVDKDAILLTKPFDKTATATKVEEKKSSKKDTKQKKTSNTTEKTQIHDLMYKYGIRVRSNLPRFSEWYSVILEYQMSDAEKKALYPDTLQPPFVEEKWSVGQFFDKDGYFDEIGLMLEMEKLYTKFETGNYHKGVQEDPEKPKELKLDTQEKKKQ